MAVQCCVCKRKLGVFDSAVRINDKVDNYVLCEKCNAVRKTLNATSEDVEFERAYAHFSRLLQDPAVPAPVKESIAVTRNWFEKRKQRITNKLDFEKRVEESYENTLMTTGDHFEGYRIKKYIGLISEDCLIEHGLGDMRDARLDSNEDDSLKARFSGREIGFVAAITAKAKERVIKRVCESATAKGANAILGISIQSDYLGARSNNFLDAMLAQYVRVSVTGTAVWVEKVETES